MKKTCIMFLVLSSFSTPFAFGAINDLGNGTVLDDATGLTWQKEFPITQDEQEAPIKYTWEDALTYCNTLDLGGSDEWRLPSRNELHSIVDYTQTVAPLADNQFSFPNNGNRRQTWTSTSADYDSARGWGVNFDNGYVFGDLKTDAANGDPTHFVRCVRGSQQRSITSSVAGANGTVAPLGSRNINYGASTSFTLTPNAHYHASVDLQGGCTGSFNAAGTTYTLDAIDNDCSVTFSFTLDTYPVSAAISGTGTITPSQYTAVLYNTTVEFVVQPENGHHLVSVSGTEGTGCNGGTLVGNTYTTNAITGACTVTTTFGQNGSVTVSEPTNGSVVSVPPGIDCPGTCSHTFDNGQQVLLRATATQGYSFTGWTGTDCSGSENCGITISEGQNYDIGTTFEPGNAFPWNTFLPAILSSCPNANNPRCSE